MTQDLSHDTQTLYNDIITHEVSSFSKKRDKFFYKKKLSLKNIHLASMDNVLFLNKEGKLFNLEPPSPYLYSIFDDSQTASYETILNRISNTDWCFWAISANFEVKLFVYDRDDPITVNECVYENQVCYFSSLKMT